MSALKNFMVSLLHRSPSYLKGRYDKFNNFIVLNNLTDTLSKSFINPCLSRNEMMQFDSEEGTVEKNVAYFFHFNSLKDMKEEIDNIQDVFCSELFRLTKEITNIDNDGSIFTIDLVHNERENFHVDLVRNEDAKECIVFLSSSISVRDCF